MSIYEFSVFHSRLMSAKKGKARGGGGKAFEKLKGKAPSDGVGQGKRVTGRSNW